MLLLKDIYILYRKEEKIWKPLPRDLLKKERKEEKDLKSQLGLRSIHHQHENRTAGHLFIGVLEYHLLIAIEHQLRQSGDHQSWGTVKKELSTYVRNTIAFHDKHGDLYHVRLSSTPESHHKEIFRALSVPLFNKRCFLFIGSRS